MFDDNYLNEFSDNCYTKSLKPNLPAIWEKYGVAHMRHLVINKKLKDHSPNWLTSPYTNLDNFVGYSIINGSDKPVVVLNSHGYIQRFPGDKTTMMTRLEVMVRVNDIHNVKLPVFKKSTTINNDIGKLISAVLMMHFEYLKTCVYQNNRIERPAYPIEFCFSINLSYFLDNKHCGILYIPGLNISIGHEFTNFGNALSDMETMGITLGVTDNFVTLSKSWVYAHVVDNDNVLPPVWTMVLGKVTRVHVKRSVFLANGLYIYTGEVFEENDGEAYYYDKEALDNDKAIAYGFSINKQDVEAGKCNSLYQSLSLEYDKIKSRNDALEQELVLLRDVNKLLEKERESHEKIKNALEKALSIVEDLRAKDRVKIIETARLKEQIERSKQEVKDSQNEGGFRFTGLVITAITGIIGIFAGLKKLLSK